MSHHDDEVHEHDEVYQRDRGLQHDLGTLHRNGLAARSLGRRGVLGRRTSQLALPAEVCEATYAEEGYDESRTNLAGVSLESDGIFADGHALQLARVTGSVEDGWTATLNVPV